MAEYFPIVPPFDINNPTNGQVLIFENGVWINGSGGGGGAVTMVSNSDGTLTITPTTGAVVASLALAHSNTWTNDTYFASVNAVNAYNVFFDSSGTGNFAVFGSGGGSSLIGCIQPGTGLTGNPALQIGTQSFVTQTTDIQFQTGGGIYIQNTAGNGATLDDGNGNMNLMGNLSVAGIVTGLTIGDGVTNGYSLILNQPSGQGYQFFSISGQEYWIFSDDGSNNFQIQNNGEGGKFYITPASSTTPVIFAVDLGSSTVTTLNNILDDGSGNLTILGYFSTDNGNIFSDGGGDLSVNGTLTLAQGAIVTDEMGNMTIAGTLYTSAIGNQSNPAELNVTTIASIQGVATDNLGFLGELDNNGPGAWIPLGTTSTQILDFNVNDSLGNAVYVVMVGVNCKTGTTLSSLTVTWTSNSAGTAMTQTLASGLVMTSGQAQSYMCVCDATTATDIIVSGNALATGDIYVGAVVFVI